MALNELFDSLNKDQDSKILTTNNLFPHFANRFHTYVWLLSTIIPEYIVMDLRNVARFYDRVGNTSFISQLRKLISMNQYGVYAFKSGILFLKLGYRDEPIILEPYTMRYDYRYLFSHSLNYSLTVDSESLVILSGIVYDKDTPTWFGPYTVLIPGQYSLKIRMKLYEERCLEETFIEVSADKGNLSITGLIPISSSSMRIDEWILIDLVFTIDKTYLDIEFRG